MHIKLFDNLVIKFVLIFFFSISIPFFAQLNPTVFNENKTVWAWNSGEYISIHWAPDSNATYDLYKWDPLKNSWNKLNENRLKRNSFIDSNIDYDLDFYKYRVTLKSEAGKELREYNPVKVKLNRVNNQNFDSNTNKQNKPNQDLSKNKVTTDSEFLDDQSMDVNDIQNFLENVVSGGSYLATYSEEVNGITQTAAEIIYNASQNYNGYNITPDKINAEVILTTLQKEQSLVTTNTTPSQSQLDLAMGYEDPNYYGFTHQIDAGTWQFRTNWETIVNEGDKNGWGVGITKTSLDGVSITPENIATAVLYAYTPYAGQGWGGSGGGNYLYYDVYYDLFQFGDGTQSISPPSLTSPGSSSPPGPDITTTTPTFQWDEVSEAEGYGLYISKKTGQTWDSYELVFDSENLGVITNDSYDLPSGYLVPGEEYRWNMRSYNGSSYSNEFSERLYFQTQPDPVSPPDLIDPGSSSPPGPVVSTTPTFKWEEVSEANGYGLYIDKKIGSTWDNFDQVYNTDTDHDGALYGAQFNLPSGYLDSGSEYRWYMGSYNSQGTITEMSEPIYFRTTGYAALNSGVTVTPSNIEEDDDFQISFTLKETLGVPITISEIKCSILDESGNHVIDLSSYSNFTIQANDTWTYNATGNLNSAGTYQAVARGKVNDWFNFTTTGSGNNHVSFTIQESSSIGDVSIVSPNGGEQWFAGTIHNVEWNITENINIIDLKFISDGSQNWISIAESLSPSSNSYEWHIPTDINSTDCRIKIVGYYNNNSVTDVSNDYFSILQNTPNVSTDSVNNVTQNSAQINGSINPNGLNTSYYFEWGTTDSYGNQTASQNVGTDPNTVSVSQVLTDLTPNTVYHYRIVAENDAGTSYGNNKTFQTTLSHDTSDTKIAFVSNRDGNYEIYLMNSDGNNLVRLTNNDSADLQPVISPDGSRIVFRSTRDGNDEIYLMNAVGTNVTRLTNNNAIDTHPAWSPNGDKIAFTSDRNGNKEIYVMNDDGTNPINLTNHPDDHDNDANWSPDGTKILFTSWRSGPAEIWVMESDGSNVTQITDDGQWVSNPIWSPDGEQIVYKAQWNIYLIEPDGTNQTLLHEGEYPEHTYVDSWSPDGMKLAVSTDHLDNNKEIYLMDSDGSNFIRLTDNSAEDGSPSWGIGNIDTLNNIPYTNTLEASNILTTTAKFNASVNPNGISTSYYFEWGETDSYGNTTNSENIGNSTNNVVVSQTIDGLIPNTTYHYRVIAQNNDGTSYGDDKTFQTQIQEDTSDTKIAFASDRDGNYEIYLMNPDGSNIIRLTYDDSTDSQPAISPNGSKIAFRSTRDQNSEIYLMHANGSNLTRLTNNNATDGHPAWSPDGEKIAFTTDRDGNSEIYVMNSDGSNKINLTNHPDDNDNDPDWSPDGSKILFTSWRSGPSEIWSMDSEGNNVTQITDNGQWVSSPQWSPTDDKIVYSAQGSIYLIDSDGTNQTTLFEGDCCDSPYITTWSPDGSKFALFSDKFTGNHEIYIMDSDGSNLTRITNNISKDVDPSWAIGDIESQTEFTELNLDTIVVAKGGSAKLPLLVNLPDTISVSSGYLNIVGNFDLFQNVTIDTNNTLLGNYGWQYAYNFEDSSSLVTFAGANTINESGTLFNYNLTVPQNADTGFIPFAIDSAYFDYGDIQVHKINGGIRIISAQPTLYGDVDLDGQIIPMDAALILKHLVGIDTLSAGGMLNANVSLDTTVSALDASLILQYTANNIDSLPVDTTDDAFLANGTLEMKDDTLSAGDIVQVPIKLKNADNIYSLEGLVEFDPNILNYESMDFGSDIQGFKKEITSQSGSISFVGAGSTHSISGNPKLALLNFTISEEFEDPSTTIKIAKLRWNENKIISDAASSIIYRKTTGIKDENNVPKEYTLKQNYPNPFNPNTIIRYGLPKESNVSIRIFDLSGQQVKKLIVSHQQAGWHKIVWDATNDFGNPVSTGIYLYRIKANNFIDVKKMLLLK